MQQDSPSSFNQKSIKIIGLQVNEPMGILRSCEMQFNPENHLVAIKGAVGSGKTTLQKSLKLGTIGSDVLKYDKQLFGNIDQEIQLADGDKRIFVGCKTSTEGGLDYVIYEKDETGKKIKNPVVDGVKLTPASYLKALQTELTWRMDELMSDNPTVQKNLLLTLFKSELAGLGVVFDKKHSDWNNSILGRIEIAENERSMREFERKSVGGFANQLEPLGIDVDDESTFPQSVDISEFESKKQRLIYQIENISQVKQQILDGITNKAQAKKNEIKALNNELMQKNREIEQEFEVKKQQYSQNVHTLNGIKTDLQTLVDQKCLTLEEKTTFVSALDAAFSNPGAVCGKLHNVVVFGDDGKINADDLIWQGDEPMLKLLNELKQISKEYIFEKNKAESTVEMELELKSINETIEIAKATNKKRAMLDSFLAWREANDYVFNLRAEYASMLASVNTGVEGLKINVDRDGDSMSIFMTYNGAFDPVYFSNTEMVDRKLTGYSGTQKPLICLLLQNYLLSKKPKALRYLWIDDVPIDSKTQKFLEKMGEKLDVTIIVNITGDFDREKLGDGEILIEGGEIFFKN